MPRLLDYGYVPIPLDLSAAVTMTATIVAELPPRETHAENSWHQSGLFWLLQDTLDDENWHDLMEFRCLNPGSSKGIVRLSSPLGLRGRLGLKVVIGGRASTPGYEFCDDDPCRRGFDHDAFPVRNVRFDVAIRTI